MILGFGKYAREKRLVGGLRKRPLDQACLEQLRGLLAVQQQRTLLPWGLLWKMQVLANKALSEVPESDPRYTLLKEIVRGALWEVQYRELRGV